MKKACILKAYKKVNTLNFISTCTSVNALTHDVIYLFDKWRRKAYHCQRKSQSVYNSNQAAKQAAVKEREKAALPVGKLLCVREGWLPVYVLGKTPASPTFPSANEIFTAVRQWPPQKGAITTQRFSVFSLQCCLPCFDSYVFVLSSYQWELDIFFAYKLSLLVYKMKRQYSGSYRNNFFKFETFSKIECKMDNEQKRHD